ncbi:hypothetical protein [Desulfobacter latus]|uniref:Uncharacterized protein n=1 Tax=Desulfobacter latus TaxID=2292 RepID=A0A850SW54_9BACT|nr:hypothetical protein [Desulfobacter latus]NWH05564.1 hypothetical protein [Desulfobacter latus]
MTQTDPNKLYIDADNNISAGGEQPKLKNNATFLQLPAELEKEMNAYLNKLAKEKNIEWENDQGAKSVFQSQGCFFVISLEKIEALMKLINSCLSLNEGDMDEIKKNLNKSMDIINGI